MMILRYRLQVLLTVKERMKRRAEMELAVAFKRLMEEKEKLKSLEEELQEIVNAWKEARSEMIASQVEGVLVGIEHLHVNFLKKLKEDEKEKQDEIETQQEAIEKAEANVAKARQEYLEAARELQVMEKHKELWMKKAKGELSRAEAKQLNEIGHTIHQLKRWRGEKSVFEL